MESSKVRSCWSNWVVFLWSQFGWRSRARKPVRSWLHHCMVKNRLKVVNWTLHTNQFGLKPKVGSSCLHRFYETLCISPTHSAKWNQIKAKAELKTEQETEQFFKNVYLSGIGQVVCREFPIKPILMHHPVCFQAFWSSSLVENKCFLHTNKRFSSENLLILPGCLPITGLSCPVSPQTGWILSIPRTEEVPFFLTRFCFIY